MRIPMILFATMTLVGCEQQRIPTSDVPGRPEVIVLTGDESVAKVREHAAAARRRLAELEGPDGEALAAREGLTREEAIVRARDIVAFAARTDSMENGHGLSVYHSRLRGPEGPSIARKAGKTLEELIRKVEGRLDQLKQQRGENDLPQPSFDYECPNQPTITLTMTDMSFSYSGGNIVWFHGSAWHFTDDDATHEVTVNVRALPEREVAAHPGEKTNDCQIEANPARTSLGVAIALPTYLCPKLTSGHQATGGGTTTPIRMDHDELPCQLFDPTPY